MFSSLYRSLRNRGVEFKDESKVDIFTPNLSDEVASSVPSGMHVRRRDWSEVTKGYTSPNAKLENDLHIVQQHMVKMQGIQKKNFEWVIEQTQNLLLKKYEPKTGKFEGVCCIYDRSEYTAAQQFCRPVFFSENGKPRREALELARVWVSIFKQLGLTPQKQIQIKKSEDSDKLVAVDVQPVAEP